MLNESGTKRYFLVVYALLLAVQIYFAYSSELFVDEAFYWLEGQFLAWSYSEVPGWVPWTLAFSDWLFPEGSLWLRLPNLLAAASVPWLAMILAEKLQFNHRHKWLTGTLILSLPIIGLTGVLALADIWIVVFTLLGFITLFTAIEHSRSRDFIILGLVLALGLNVHIRFWFIVLITALVVFTLYRKEPQIIKALLLKTLPVMALGLVPILIFNLQNEFPLLAFQLNDRHPWEFQLSHFSFFLTQIIITTPLVFYLCLKTATKAHTQKHHLTKLITYTAIIHWLFYALAGFYSDNLRLNVHWTTVSYLLLLIATVAVNTTNNHKIIKWTAVTGFMANLLILSTLIYWQQIQTPKSALNERIALSAQGWSELAQHTEQVRQLHNKETLIADHFMTLAQLKYHSNTPIEITALPHPLNQKHGRAGQLELMGLTQASTTQPHLVLIEHSALKLDKQINYYQNTCTHMNGLQLVDSFDLFQGLKTYHYFISGGGVCELPPIVYHEINAVHISGWVLHPKTAALALQLSDDPTTVQTTAVADSELKQNDFFRSIDSRDYGMTLFEVNTLNLPKDKPLQLSIKMAQNVVLSQRLD